MNLIPLYILISLLLVTKIYSLDLVKVQSLIQKDASVILKLVGPHLGWSDTLGIYYRAFHSNLFNSYIGEEPIFIYELTFTDSWGQLGNRLGHYFEVISFCKKAGIHFVGFMRTDREQPSAILADSLPTTILHSNPAANRSQAISNLKGIIYNDWPWTTFGTETFNNLAQISLLTQKIAENFESKYSNVTSNNLNPKTFDLVTNSNGKLPYIPYAAILFRCADLIGDFHYHHYGLLNFNVYLMTIPKNAKEIYILSEPLSYGNGHVLCNDLITRLTIFLSEHYPHTTIAVRRGHPQDGFVQLSKAKYVVCCPSTFCLWPALGNVNNQVFYQPSELVAQGKQLFMHLNFHWISFPKIYSHMMSLDDQNKPLETSKALADMLSTVQPRCESCMKSMQNSRFNTLNWDCSD